jgi:hypothetical protein
MRKSNYKAGTFLADSQGHVFIHNGYITGDGYGVLIGETCEGKIERSSGFENFCKYPIRGVATEREAFSFMCKVMSTEIINHY